MMKFETVQEKMTAIHRWTLKQRDAVLLKRDESKEPHQKAMLAGKAKAYLDVACFLQDRFGKYLILDKF
jgi:hypothetical protein